MERLNSAAQTPGTQPLEGFKGILDFIQKLKAQAPIAAATSNEQLGPELAYKIAQAVARASDLDLLRDSITSLVNALDGINIALSRAKME
jgi:hypothetical protein